MTAVEELSLPVRVAKLEQQMTMIAARIGPLDPLDENPKSIPSLAHPEIHQIALLTQELFREIPTVEVDADPSDADSSFVVFNVVCSGDFDASLALELEWHRRLEALKPEHVGDVRLNLIPQ
ncbi:MAG: hypothetical protein SFV23_21710 [Planctomycetaceae bacterium]|nr:hypothetical protein [Planctomycetaceae bacterium]